jgi:hypothetical protein
MPKTASSTDIKESIYETIIDSRSHPSLQVDYIADDLSTKVCDDVKSVSCGLATVSNDYNQFSLMPPASTFSMSVDNRGSKYSPETGLEFDGVLVRDRKVIPKLGYVIDSATGKKDSEAVLSLGTSDIIANYNTQLITGKRYNDSSTHHTDSGLAGITLKKYDDYNGYDKFNYQYPAYVVFSVNPSSTIRNNLSALSVTSDTTGIRIYIRAVDDSEVSNGNHFVYLGNTISGTIKYELAELTGKYLQIAYVWDTNQWSNTSGYIEAPSIEYFTDIEYFKQGTYLLDDPSFNAKNGSYDASTKGRDQFKKVYESKITLPIYSGADLIQIFRDVADRCGIDYDTTTLPTLGYTFSLGLDADTDETRDYSYKNKTGKDILQDALIYLNAVSDIDYRLKINEDAKMELWIKQTSVTNADFQYDWRFNLLSINKKYDSNNFLKRATVTQGRITKSTEYELKDSGIISTTGTKTLDWSLNTVPTDFSVDAIDKRIEVVVQTGTMDFTITSLTNKVMTYEVTGSGTLQVKIYGSYAKNGHLYFGEWIEKDNFVNDKGITKEVKLNLAQSDANAIAIAKKMGAEYGNQNYSYGLSVPYDPLVEIGDRIMLWERYTNTESILVVQNINHSFNASGAKATTSLKLSDIGFDFDNYKWDRENVKNGGDDAGSDDILWDTGFIWDQDLGVYADSDPDSVEVYRDIV